MMTWTKDKTGNYRAYTGAGTYTIKRRPDGWFDLYGGRKKLNDKRDRLYGLKTLAESYATDATTYKAEVGDRATMLDQLDAENPPESVPGDERETVLYRLRMLNADPAVERLESIHPKARDMVDRATTLLPGEGKSPLPDFAPDDSTAGDKAKSSPMPCAEHRTEEDEGYAQYSADFFASEARPGGYLNPNVVEVQADGHFLTTRSEEYKVQLNLVSGAKITPQVAFARVPRGTARKLRKALRAAGRPDLAAVSRVSESRGAV